MCLEELEMSPPQYFQKGWRKVVSTGNFLQVSILKLL